MPLVAPIRTSSRSIPTLLVVKGLQGFLCSFLEPLGFGCRVIIATMVARIFRIFNALFVLEAMVKDPACLRVPQFAFAHQGQERNQCPLIHIEVLLQQALEVPKFRMRHEGQPRRCICHSFRNLLPKVPPVLEEFRIHVCGFLSSMFSEPGHFGKTC